MNSENIPNLLRGMVSICREHNGSDIHLLEGEPPRVRLQGDLKPIDVKNHPHVTREDIEEVLNMALTPEQQKELKEKGDVDFSMSFEHATGRVNVGYANGRRLHLAMRYLSNEIIPLDELGINPKALKEIANSEAGLIIVTGETSSGKTTTIIAMLDYINQNHQSAITTIENPVEYSLVPAKSLISRREVGRDTPSFHDALRASVRKNPDVLLIGEVRDGETGEIAITAAETGILTFCTMHAIGAIPAVKRLAHIMVSEATMEEGFNVRLSYALRAVIAQQLVKAISTKKYIPLFEILNITDIEKNYLRAGDYNRLEQSLESDRSISLGECVYNLWHQDPRPIDENLIKKLFGSQANQVMSILKDRGGYKPINAWMG